MTQVVDSSLNDRVQAISVVPVCLGTLVGSSFVTARRDSHAHVGNHCKNTFKNIILFSFILVSLLKK